jgi:hypothetical protein
MGQAQECDRRAGISCVVARSEDIHRANTRNFTDRSYAGKHQGSGRSFHADEWRDFNAGFSQIQIVGAPNHEFELRGEDVEAKPKL